MGEKHKLILEGVNAPLLEGKRVSIETVSGAIHEGVVQGVNEGVITGATCGEIEGKDYLGALITLTLDNGKERQVFVNAVASISILD